MNYWTSAWEPIGVDAHGGKLYRLPVFGGWLVQSYGGDYSNITFMPDPLRLWVSSAPPTQEKEDKDDPDKRGCACASDPRTRPPVMR